MNCPFFNFLIKFWFLSHKGRKKNEEQELLNQTGICGRAEDREDPGWLIFVSYWKLKRRTFKAVVNEHKMYLTHNCNLLINSNGWKCFVCEIWSAFSEQITFLYRNFHTWIIILTLTDFCKRNTKFTC